AIIIDEAHSSASGQIIRKLNQTLSQNSAVSDEDDEIVDETGDTITNEDLVTMVIRSMKMMTNASYFAFTATPKNKTLELFGLPYQEGDKTKFRACHLYSMRQAI